VIRVCGLDLSLAKTGVAHLESEVDDVWVLSTHRIVTPPHPKGDTRALRDRMAYIRSSVAVEAEHSVLVVMEGPSFASVGASSKDLMGLWWMCYDRLVRDHRVVVVPPSSLKKWATGKGNAGKPQVAVGLHRTFPQAVFRLDFAAVDDNEADAAGLCGMGAQLLGLPAPIEYTKYRQEALSGLRLPEKEAA
jgi:crossover junction endodeoxyribonuclease RuvC